MRLDELTPAQIVQELDKYIIGQDQAKRTVAIALRNRARRKRLPESIRDEVSPKNIIMIGPTGVGKTEIARRIAKLANTPFIKVEATKYTEVGYVGRDVESMVRDLMGTAVQMVKKEMAESRKTQVDKRVEERLLDMLLPSTGTQVKSNPSEPGSMGTELSEASLTTRDKFRKLLSEGRFDDREVELVVHGRQNVQGIELLAGNSLEDLENTIQNLGSIFGGKPKRRKVSIKRARELITEEEMEKSVDQERVVEIAKEQVEQMGIIFIDEIDKIASTKQSMSSGPDVSREGVQRDILPIVEGSKISTKWGMVDTTHILFIAAGAFHVSKPSDLIPELQGRFPLRVELSELTSEDFERILKEPENAIIKQYIELMRTENVELIFSENALKTISDIAYKVNSTTENIGARRLYTIMERLLEDISFKADELSGQTVTVTPQYVEERLSGIIENEDLSRYIL
ncbi:MAG: ATP-dependent protease ATPase subunit HslU [Sphaerochaetaceae bacterium]|jgi:ATP-dependent HslUV protease ATP-binding subunit HslU|nr:ATP-dependent protease ATPase subunit HslU [Sphaerochaetaceae bacterium]NLO61255.1 ATP-dependent protease ATPase subunit HslU [Spirochaetales bacterium]MDD2406947.1 ATP-dependent protease ATPase subunit HslU [Sphaerochaetaceae bacterium]MDD3670234.1 ATP-dependent protease ATPase subunit HslU [Sphaerochaetaceae bacterium]MDD4259097.1 ATP-dependent protease ATPase subunit HslU [Sphaerochaetaceae bacterium]